MGEQQSQEVKDEYKNLSEEYSLLKGKLDILFKDKEQAYRTLKSCTDKIISRTQKINEIKSERDAFTKEVKVLKKKRTELHKTVKDKSVQHQKSQDQNITESKPKSYQKPSYGRKNSREDRPKTPSFLKKQIEIIETKIETEVMPFTKEQQLKKQIKEIKRELLQLKEASQATVNLAQSSKELQGVKSDAQSIHKEVQEAAQKSQEKHENLTTLVKEIRELRSEKKKTSTVYGTKKKEYEEIKKQLDVIAQKKKDMSKEMGMNKKQSFASKVKEKTREVEEKIKLGKKLSTEDLLAMQASDE